ncbi:MAG: hypothetical protein ABWY16_02385 [Pedobacter sp.]
MILVIPQLLKSPHLIGQSTVCVVNNGTVNKIDVIDFKNPANMKVIGSILIAPYGGAVNSVTVSDGKLAAAIESTNKQANGKVADCLW